MPATIIFAVEYSHDWDYCNGLRKSVPDGHFGQMQKPSARHWFPICRRIHFKIIFNNRYREYNYGRVLRIIISRPNLIFVPIQDHFIWCIQRLEPKPERELLLCTAAKEWNGILRPPPSKSANSTEQFNKLLKMYLFPKTSIVHMRRGEWDDFFILSAYLAVKQNWKSFQRRNYLFLRTS